MVLLAVIQGQLKEILEEEEVIGQEGNIICLAKGGDFVTININTKLSILSSRELVTIVNSVKISRGDPTLLKSKFIINWTKDFIVPL